MTIKQYQTEALKTYNVSDHRLTYLRLGMRGEAGEVCDKVKKLIRDNSWVPGTPVQSPELRHSILLELGDVLWYLVIYAYEMHTEQICGINMDSLELSTISGYYSSDLAEHAIDLADLMTLSHVNIWEAVVEIITMAKILDSSINEVCQLNIQKLADRSKRDMIRGSGDYR